MGHHLRLGPALSVLWGPQSVLNLWKHYTLKPQRSFCPNTSHFELGRSLVFRLSLSCPPKTVVCKLQILFERDHWRLLCPEISQRSSKHGHYEDMCPTVPNCDFPELRFRTTSDRATRALSQLAAVAVIQQLGRFWRKDGQGASIAKRSLLNPYRPFA